MNKQRIWRINQKPIHGGRYNAAGLPIVGLVCNPPWIIRAPRWLPSQFADRTARIAATADHGGLQTRPTMRRVAPALAILLAALLLAGCGELAFTGGPLLYDVAFSNTLISPNADGVDDATEIKYSLRRPANVSIYFENDAGERLYFRNARRRAPGDYSVLWGGVVDEPETIQTDYGPVQVLSRVLPDGAYRWVIEATDDGGQTAQATGAITLQDGDTTLPELHNFAVVPTTFRPNQDGLRDDWVSISYYLNKDVASIGVYLADPDQPAVRTFVAEKAALVEPTEMGYHEYRYEGGVDLNAEPPPDGTYNVIGEARDAAGNAIQVIRELTIEEGGKPRAEIAQGEVDWEGEVNRVVLLPLGGKLCFRAIVSNVGAVPIRTSGPWPGQEFKVSENYNTLAAQQAEQAGDESWFPQPGVWRFGINFDTTGVDFPFRWAVGSKEQLEMRLIDGKEQYYLMPGKSGEVSGCIVMDEELPVGTEFWWAGLIHQSVDVPNNNVDRITVQVGAP